MLLALVLEPQTVHRQRLAAQLAEPVATLLQVVDRPAGLGVGGQRPEDERSVEVELARAVRRGSPTSYRASAAKTRRLVRSSTSARGASRSKLPAPDQSFLVQPESPSVYDRSPRSAT